MVLLQELLLGCSVRTHDAARVYDAAYGGKNQVFFLIYCLGTSINNESNPGVLLVCIVLDKFPIKFHFH